MNIVQIATMEIGGAGKIARELHDAYRQRKLNSHLLVGYKHLQEPTILQLSHEPYYNLWERWWRRLGEHVTRQSLQLRSLCYLLGNPYRWLHYKLGHEDFNFPGTWHIFNHVPQKSDILHCHNLHGEYFDLRALPWLSQQVPVVLTLHDAWLLSGHCAHSLGCKRWKTGCGECPDLTLPIPLQRDASAYNWQRKQWIYSQSRLYLTTPCHWLMNEVEQSILTPAILDKRVIPHGIDLSIFHPANKQIAREELHLPPQAKIMLFVAQNAQNNPWKDYNTLQKTLTQLSQNMASGEIFMFLSVGGEEQEKSLGQITLMGVPFQKDPKLVARYYQAANIYVHAAKADTFPNTILEALACGTPVVATNIGGIPEQIDNGITGFLVPPGNAEAMASSIKTLLDSPSLQQQMGEQAEQMARQRFDAVRMVNEYLGWYHDILSCEHDHRTII